MTYVINSLKSQRKLPLAPVFERADIVHKNEGNRACDVIPRLCKGGGICDVEAKMAAPLSTMKFWKPGK